MGSILFVCTANMCRSPMAVAIFRDQVERMQPEKKWRIESAGTWASTGHPAISNVQEVMEELGFDVSGHISRPISEDLLKGFNLILTMERSHKEALRVEFPELASKIYLLSEMADRVQDVEDPIGGPMEEFRVTAREIEDILNRGFDKICEQASG